MPQSSVSAPAIAGTSCGVVSVLPLLYIAWADGVLTPAQLEEICERVEAQPWLSEEDKRTLAGWLDPANPPSPTEYHGWRQAVQMAAGHLPPEKRHSLPDLGVALARVAGTDGSGADDGFSTPEAREALAEMEHLLGIVTPEALRELLDERPRPDGDRRTEQTFPVEAMTALLDAPHGDLRRKIRTLLRDPAFAYAGADLSTAEYRDWVLQRCRLLADQGLGALSYPEKHGGSGDLAAFIAAFETLAYHDLSVVVKFGVQFGLFGGSIQQLGTEKHHAEYLPQIGSLELPGCFAMSELGHGSNVRELGTTATYDAETEEFVVHTPREAARKEWIGNAARHGQVATVFAQLRVPGEDEDDRAHGQTHGVHALLVPIRDENGAVAKGVRIEDNGRKMGLNGVDNGRLWFDGVRVPRENLLDRFAQVSADGTYSSEIPSSGKRFFTMLSTLVGGRISVAAAGLSATKSALTIAVRYGARRRQFGPSNAPERPILDYRTHQRRLFPLLAETYALDFAIGRVTARFADRQATGEDLRRVEGEAAALKAMSTWNATRAIQTARECCGGQGYLMANRLPQLKADADIFTTFEGDNTILMLQVAKGLLSEFQQELQDMNFFGLARFIAEAAARRVTERNPLHGRETSREHLRDADFQTDAFTFRERALLQAVAQRLKQRLDDGMDSFDAFIECQDHLLSLAHAHAERLAMDAFAEGVETCDDDALRPVLATLRDLYALSRLEEGVGWFQEKHYIEAGQAHAIRREVNALCAELRPPAVDLVDAFAIPDEALAAPIATDERTPEPEAG
jgi:acyl-CoA oxidase